MSIRPAATRPVRSGRAGIIQTGAMLAKGLGVRATGHGATPSVVSALVCTRNRAESLLRVVRSLLQEDDDFELIVMDQSDGQESEEALSVFRRDERLRYVRSGARGKGAALNEGLRLARGGVVVCTDDDCEAPP
jgi:cellulose synthase/poly-beta-1,6-N-acetylglucosamine synthase-like glycosyltransferase